MTEQKTTPAPRKPLGCWVMPALLALAFLGLGGWLLGHWNAIPGVGKVAAIMLVVIGTLIMIPVLIWLAIVITVRWFVGKVNTAMGQAVQRRQAMYGTVHEFSPPNTEDWEELDEEFYATATETLRGAGFRHLGDVVDRTLAQIAGYRTVIRVMVSQGGTTMVGIYDISAMPGLKDRVAHIFDVTTEFSDGMFLITCNTADTDLTNEVPGIERRRHPGQSEVLSLIDIHEKEKESLIAARPDRHALVVNTLEEAIESEKRQQTKKNQFRRESGYIQADEVRRIAERSGQDAQTTEVVVEVSDAAQPKPGETARKPE